MDSPESAYIETYTGKIFHILAPTVDEICIEDIAHALSQQCRFTGHTRVPYSVAEHSIYVSELCPKEYALWGLLHDASEAYISDLNSPLKTYSALGDYYKEIEARLMKVIGEKFGLFGHEPPEVKKIDYEMLWVEKSQLLTSASWGDKWPAPKSVPDIKIAALPSREAEAAFLERYTLLTGGDSCPN